MVRSDLLRLALAMGRYTDAAVLEQSRAALADDCAVLCFNMRLIMAALRAPACADVFFGCGAGRLRCRNSEEIY